MSEHGASGFQSSNAVLSPVRITGRACGLTCGVFDFTNPFEEVFAFLPVKVGDCIKPKAQTCVLVLTRYRRGPRLVRMFSFSKQTVELFLLLLNGVAEILIHMDQLMDCLFQHAVLVSGLSVRGC